MKEPAKRLLRWVLSLGFFVTGAAHFFKPALYIRIVPPELPYPSFLVYVSGACEILGAAGMLLPRFRKAAGYGLLALLVAVYPANIYMALHPEMFTDVASPAELYLRLPLQFVFIAWVWWCCIA